ncbi:MAG TPA: glycerophosphodiester phosphodiesterase [Acidimicrobiales bacterium]|nr:glycerophosphodiester phosphodiesterase [Acidimicrobiales bacterium]
MSVWTQRRVINFAHQGGSFEGPSSTLHAMARALQNGANALELDVHATRDRRLVVCHDETVDRTTNHTGVISELSLEQLREMDNAYWWIEGSDVAPGHEDDEYVLRGRAPADARLSVATLAEVADAFPGVLLNLDIKQSLPNVEAYEELLAREIAKLDLIDRVIVASFLDDAMVRFRALAPRVATSAATQETTAFYFSMLDGTAIVPPAKALQVPMTYGEIRVVDERFVTTAHEAGLAVHVWTLNDEAGIDEALDLGVDGIISDRPSLTSALLAARGVAWDGRLG